MKLIQSYCYDDVLLRPKHSEIRSRRDISLHTTLGYKDKTDDEAKLMRSKENYYLTKF